MKFIYKGRNEIINVSLCLAKKENDNIKLPENDIIKPNDIIIVPKTEKELIKRLKISGFEQVSDNKANTEIKKDNKTKRGE